MPGIALKIDLNELYALVNSKRLKSCEIGKIKADLLGRYYKRELENTSNCVLTGKSDSSCLKKSNGWRMT